MYITKQQIRQLGLYQPDELIMPFLEKVNQRVASCIDDEIPKEIKQNYDDDTLKQWYKLRSDNDFSSLVVQDWLKKKIKSLDSIVVDWVQITLGDLKRIKQKASNE